MAKVKWCSCSQHQHGGRSSSKAVQQWLVFVKALHKWMSLKARKSFNIYRVIYLVIKFIKVPLSWLGILHIYNIWNPVIRIAIYLVVWKFYLRGRFGCWRRANARNVRLYYPYWQYTDLFIFRFVSLLYLRSTLRLCNNYLFNLRRRMNIRSQLKFLMWGTLLFIMFARVGSPH